MSAPHPIPLSALDAAKRLADYADLMAETRENMDRIADEWRKRWGRNQEAYLEGREA